MLSMSHDFPDINCDQLPLEKLGRARTFYVKISIDGQEQYRTAPAKGRSSISWGGICFLYDYIRPLLEPMLIYRRIREVLESSVVEIQVYENHIILGIKCIGSFDDSAENLLSECRLPFPVTLFVNKN